MILNLYTHTMFRIACVTVLVLSQFSQTSIAQQNPECAPSSCGDVQNISYPFRLKTDPINCGETSYEVACEHNLTVLNLFSQKYYVKAINYSNFTIRLIDATIQTDNCSSLPHHSLARSNFYDDYPYDHWYPYNPYNHRWRGSEIFPDIAQPISFISCPYQVHSPLYVDAAPCIHGIDSWRRNYYYYAKLGHLNASDVRDLCRIEFMAMTSFPVKDDANLSFSEIHHALLYGFELSWFQGHCKSCPKWKYCYIHDDADNISCYDRSFFPSGILDLLYVIGICLLYLLMAWIALQIALRIVCGIPCTFIFLIYTWRRRHLSMFDTIEGYLQCQNNLIPIRYTYSEIKKMTKGFKDKLGEGGYGCVYKGNLRSGGLVAIKLLGKSKANGQDFINEVATIGRIHHVNVVQLIGFCAERSKRALVYEFMPNGSLEKYIFSREENISVLSVEKKYDIVLGVAHGIEYLHRGCDIQILHFDIKPHNILLDDNFVPKVSDFGLAKLCPSDINTVPLTAARGTIGYVAPELINRSIGGVSYKADVYSFGMLLMEILGLRSNPIATEENSNQYFPSWVYDQFKKGKDIEIGDAGNDEEKKMTKKMSLVALWCIQMNPVDRPSMTKVVEMLEGEVELLKIPPEPSHSPTNSSYHVTTFSEDSTESATLLCNSLNSVSLDVIID